MRIMRSDEAVKEARKAGVTLEIRRAYRELMTAEKHAREGDWIVQDVEAHAFIVCEPVAGARSA